MTRTPYNGTSDCLVIAFDIGTTYSGACVCVLHPGEVPKSFPVTPFPGMQANTGASKVPTVMYYDNHGTMIFAGAESELEENVMRIEDEELLKVEWFKLKLCPGKPSEEVKKAAARSVLPEGKDVLAVYGDFMQYMLHCTRLWFEGHFSQGDATWRRLFPTAHFVIGHPNGWEGAPQAKLRKAAVLGGLVPDNVADRARIHFVTEGEASLHFCLEEGIVREAKEVGGEGFILADLGGGTIDLSTYRVTGSNPISVSELVEAHCIVEGSTMVTSRGETYLRSKLQSSRFGSADHMPAIVSYFDKTAKCNFRDPKVAGIIKVGSVSEADQSVGITRGKLTVPGADMATFFEPSIAETVRVVKEIKAAAENKGVNISSLYLVGGFCANSFLQAELKKRLHQARIYVSVPEGHAAKAVAQGAISYYVNHFVQARVAKWTYGTRAAIKYDPSNPDHVKRQDDIEVTPAGIKFVGGAFDAIVKKGTVVKATETFTSKYSNITSTKEDLKVDSMPILVYTGEGDAPRWLDEDPLHFKSIMRVSGSQLRLPPRIGINEKGNLFWFAFYSIVIQFGLTEMKAYYTWEQDDVEHKTEGEIIYDEMMENDGDDDGVPNSLIEALLRVLMERSERP